MRPSLISSLLPLVLGGCASGDGITQAQLDASVSGGSSNVASGDYAVVSGTVSQNADSTYELLP